MAESWRAPPPWTNQCSLANQCREKKSGDSMFAGTWNLNGQVLMQVTALGNATHWQRLSPPFSMRKIAVPTSNALVIASAMSSFPWLLSSP